MRKIMLVLMVILMGSLTGCSNFTNIKVGHKESYGDITMHAYVGIEIDKRKFNIDEEVPVTFSFGHDISDRYIPEYYGGHLLEIYISDTLTDKIIEIHTINYIDDAYFIEENRCITNRVVGSIIEYNQNLTFDINFSDYDIQEGSIHIRITETYYAENMIDGVISYDTVISSEQSKIDFSINDDKVEFGN